MERLENCFVPYLKFKLMSRQKTLIFGISLMIVCILLGAFGAHALKEYFTGEMMANYDTAIRYMMIHALAFMILALGKFPSDKLKISVTLIKLGVVLFSGSIFILIALKLLSSGPLFFFIITPIGGTLMIAGWTMALIQVIKTKSIWKK